MRPPFSYKGDQLFCEDAAVAALADRFGSPLYIYSSMALVENCRAIDEAFEGYPHLTTYAVKANSNVHLLRVIAEQGLGADVGSQGELFLALQAGFPPDKISFSGVGKRDDEIEYALRRNILAFNVESKQELDVLNTLAGEVGTKARILLRLNLDLDAGTHAYTATSRKHNKFGVGLRDAPDVLRYAQALPHVELRGIHSHIGSQILDVDAFVRAATTLRAFVNELRARAIAVSDLDFGGGFGVQYHGVLVHQQIPFEKPEGKNLGAPAFITAVLPILKETGCTIAMQPGRSIIADAGAFVTRVLYRKNQEDRTFIVVDGGMNDLIRPSLYHAHHQIVPAHLAHADFERVDVVGPCCESGDFFAQDRALPHVDRGDLLAVMCTGAYGYVLSSNYNARLRPAEVLVNGVEATCIREREVLEELL